MDTLIADAAGQLLRDLFPGEIVRTLTKGGSADAPWAAIEGSGFLDALAPADPDQVLGLGDVLPILLACGHHAVPVPLAETMMARAIAGQSAPSGPISIASSGGLEGQPIRLHVPNGRHADWVVVASHDAARILPVAGATKRVGIGPDLTLEWDRNPNDAVPIERAADWQAIGALVTACRMAGAIGRMLDMSARHARDREQFGRPIGKFQAIQQQVSVLAEHAHAAHMAAQLAGRPGPDGPAHVLRERVAIAKVQVGMSAAIASSIAHAVHGAVGMSEEFDLHLYSGLVQRGRAAFGSERYWATALGTGFLKTGGRSALEEVRRLSDPSST